MKNFYISPSQFSSPRSDRRTLSGRSFCIALAALLISSVVSAQPPSAAPEGWPCVQRYQPEVSAGTFWQHELPEGVQPNDDPQVWNLVGSITERAVKLEQAREQTRNFLETQGQDLLRTAGHFVFALHELTNQKRDRVIEGIMRFSARQQLMLRRIEAQAQKLEVLRAQESVDADLMQDLQARQTWDVRVYEEREALAIHLCEQPVLLEQKFFAIGRDVASYLEEHRK